MSSIRVRSAITRGAAFIGLWLLLAGTGLADLPIGLAAAAAATWTSLHLSPPDGRRLRYAALARLLVRFGQESIMGGADVARRALDPRLPLRTGFVSYPACLAQGPARNVFCALTSALPGTLSVGTDDSGALLYHCLDVEQPVALQLANDEELLSQVLGGSDDDS